MPRGLDPIQTTRLAPSPTGALHPGNARTFLVNWAIARQRGWRVVLRIEDLDSPRVKPGVIEETIDILEWLGLDWDEGPLIQSEDAGHHAAAMERLASLGRVYPCSLTRREIEAASSAPQEGVHEYRFPNELRPPTIPSRFEPRDTSWRFIIEDGEVRFTDSFLGDHRCNPEQTVGDFVVWTKRAQAAYQLAVVADDTRQGVTQVVRGDDLLDSTGRQILLYDALGLEPRPVYTHLPMVVGEDGRRLAKRHGDTRLSQYRTRGIPAERIVGLIASWCGIGPMRPMSSAEFVERLEVDRIPRERVVFGPGDERWIVGN